MRLPNLFSRQGPRSLSSNYSQLSTLPEDAPFLGPHNRVEPPGFFSPVERPGDPVPFAAVHKSEPFSVVHKSEMAEHLHTSDGEVTERHHFVTFLNAAASIMHGIWAIVMIVMAMIIANKNLPTHGMFDGLYPVVKDVTLWRTTVAADAQCGLAPYVPRPGEVSALPTQTIYLNRHSFDMGSMDIKYMIVVFFIMSSFFQAVQWGIGFVPDHCRVLRFVEYSFSAGLMIMAIALQTGIDDLFLLMTLFGLIFATNMFGLVADLLSYLPFYIPKHDEPPVVLGLFQVHYLWVLQHIAGWSWATVIGPP
jgi:hypothetical protein